MKRTANRQIMDSGTEVLRAVAAIAIAFETAADSLESIRDHKERKKRKREKDIEELFEIKILHKSLLHVRIRQIDPAEFSTDHATIAGWP